MYTWSQPPRFTRLRLRRSTKRTHKTSLSRLHRSPTRNSKPVVRTTSVTGFVTNLLGSEGMPYSNTIITDNLSGQESRSPPNTSNTDTTIIFVPPRVGVQGPSLCIYSRTPRTRCTQPHYVSTDPSYENMTPNPPLRFDRLGYESGESSRLPIPYTTRNNVLRAPGTIVHTYHFYCDCHLSFSVRSPEHVYTLPGRLSPSSQQELPSLVSVSLKS